jgi:hypothetical protein
LLDDRCEQASHLRNEGLLARIFEANPALIALGQLVCLYVSDEELSCQIALARLAYQRTTHNAAEYTGMARANFKPLPTG